VSLVSVLERNWAQTREHVEGIKTGETAASPVFMRLFAHVNENTELGGWDLVSIPPSPPLSVSHWFSFHLHFMVSALVAAVRSCERKRYIYSHMNLSRKPLFMRLLE
jgi:hypothetical protein